MTIILTIAVMVILLFLSAPIAVAIGLGVVTGLYVGDIPPEFMMEKMVSSLDSFPLLAVPFFILAGRSCRRAPWPTRSCGFPLPCGACSRRHGARQRPDEHVLWRA